MIISHDLPWPPTQNHIYTRTRSGGVCLSDSVRSWRERALLIIKADGRAAPTPPLAFALRVNPPDKRRHDPDNIIKVTLDLVLGYYGIDDTLDNVQDLTVLLCRSLEPGTVEVMVTEIECDHTTTRTE